MTFIKLDQADLDSPRRELSNGGLKSVVTLLVRWQINFLSAQTLTLNPAVAKSGHKATIFDTQQQKPTRSIIIRILMRSVPSD